MRGDVEMKIRESVNDFQRSRQRYKHRGEVRARSTARSSATILLYGKARRINSTI